jgi:Alpha-glutamyl/putrescinyl thymine pyrophosphorylase clade 3
VRGRRGTGLHVSHERRAEDDGYRSPLTPGLRASQDAERLAEEIAFAEGRLLALTTAPPDLYGEMREEEDSEQAAWMCFLSAYLCPLEGGRDSDPFAGIRRALEADWRAGELPDLEGIPLGPRTSHDPARGDATLSAYLQWAARAAQQADGSGAPPGHTDGAPGHTFGASGPQIGAAPASTVVDTVGWAPAFVGDLAWGPGRRFERLFERLTLPGLARMGRYELLLTIGRVGLCELRADALYFTNAPGAAHGDLATLGAKRVFGIGDPIHLEPRARELAKAMSVPVEALDLALANWEAGERATLGVPSEALDSHALERARAALDL